MNWFLKLMFWNNDTNEQLYVRCDIKNKRSNYRVSPDDNGRLSLLVEGEQARIKNISVSGIAFEINNHVDQTFPHQDSDKHRLRAILYIGHQHSPIPLKLELLQRNERLLRCRILELDPLIQRKLSAAITQYQKQQIRALSSSAESIAHPNSDR